MSLLEDYRTDLVRTLTARSRRILDRPEKRIAAVLVPLVQVDEAPHLLFIRRAMTLPHHQGQIAFPGGTHRLGDADLVDTALREAQEEIGLDPTNVSVLGILDDHETMGSGFVITPVVGLISHPQGWRPAPAEVDAIFTVPVRVLRADGVERQELWDFGRHRHPVDLYDVQGHIIWGATHRITKSLLALLPS